MMIVNYGGVYDIVVELDYVILIDSCECGVMEMFYFKYDVDIRGEVEFFIVRES